MMIYLSIALSVIVIIIAISWWEMKRTQNKENYYYLFWIVAMVAFIVPQVYTAVAYTRLADILKDPIEVRVVNKWVY